MDWNGSSVYSYCSLSGGFVVDDELVVVESPSNMLGRCAAAPAAAWSDLVLFPFLKYVVVLSPLHNSIIMMPQRKNRPQPCWRFILSYSLDFIL